MKEYVYDEIFVGLTESFTLKVTEKMEDMFRVMSGDNNPLHYDDSYAKKISKGKFESHVVFGMLVASLYSTMAGMYLPGKYSLIHSLEKVNFRKPVFLGDELTATGTVKEKQNDLRLIVLDVVIRNQGDMIVSSARMKILVLK